MVRRGNASTGAGLVLSLSKDELSPTSGERAESFDKSSGFGHEQSRRAELQNSAIPLGYGRQFVTLIYGYYLAFKRFILDNLRIYDIL